MELYIGGQAFAAQQVKLLLEKVHDPSASISEGKVYQSSWEPGPSRLASIAIGAGDIDCVYHFALVELLETISECGSEEAKDLMSTMTLGKRLRDISDLPLDLAV